MKTQERLVFYINNQPMLNGSVNVDQDSKTVWSQAPQPDPSWSYTDAAGHFHAHSDDEDEPYPTLDAKTKFLECDGSCGGICEGYHVIRYYCRICQEEIGPGSLRGPYKFAVPGLKSWRAEVTTGIDQRTSFLVNIDQHVSVRVVAEEQEFFGVAQIHTVRTEFEVVTAELIGIGPLGRRKP
jgi:hypothetical protein